jgi:hypothetical protein
MAFSEVLAKCLWQLFMHYTDIMSGILHCLKYTGCVVGIVTSWQAGRPSNCPSIRIDKRFVSLSVQAGCVTHPASCSIHSKGSFPQQYICQCIMLTTNLYPVLGNVVPMLNLAPPHEGIWGRGGVAPCIHGLLLNYPQERPTFMQHLGSLHFSQHEFIVCILA